MWIVLRSRNAIILVIRDICELSRQLMPKCHLGSKTTKMELLFLVAAVAILLTIQVLFFFYQEWEKNSSLIKVPFMEESSLMNVYVWIAVLSVVFTFNISASTCNLMLLLCYNSYCILYKIMESYGNKLKDELNQGKCSFKQISRYISLFATITRRVKEIDQALGTSAFILYTTTISSLFNSVSVVLADSQSYRTSVANVYVVWTTFTAIVTFLVLTFSGALVYKGGENIKQAMIDCSDIVAKHSPNLKTTLTFSLLVENIKGSNIVVTGWSMFTIQKGFILSVAGLVMTYGVLMYQMDALKTE
ncbi:uncharacterized protein CDAR_21461 [Caerostris darwini]|uniref:Gustatory receptor n=1 Tax=Caerostris darwini TaxID=1538125 RepID=A0AAV4W0T7_9ARAC|nr:uncharacterized protein CDAR_21461 [Caerostris darwini]